MLNDVQEDLVTNSLVLQHGCQTALDAFVREIPSISPCRMQANIWSKVTPYIEVEELKANINQNSF